MQTVPAARHPAPGLVLVAPWLDPRAAFDLVIAGLDAELRQLRHVTGDDTVDFELRDTREMASRIGGITKVVTGLLAAVSLVVGGIGIMNAMLVSVTERTHEIGIRMAVGALEGDVMAQFLIEAGALAALGGVVGVGVGIAATALASMALGIPFVVVPWAVVGAVVCSAGMGSRSGGCRRGERPVWPRSTRCGRRDRALVMRVRLPGSAAHPAGPLA